jgi:hypothetical protein
MARIIVQPVHRDGDARRWKLSERVASKNEADERDHDTQQSEVRERSLIRSRERAANVLTPRQR